MKKILFILSLFAVSLSGFSQLGPRKLLGLQPGSNRGGYIYKDTLRGLYLETPLFKRNDSTIAIDTSHFSGGGSGWLLSGNSITAGTDFFGTTNNTSIRMRTNNSQAAILDSNGRFGVGVLLPTSKIHLVTSGLNTTQSATAGLLLENQTAATSGQQQISPAVVMKVSSWNTSAVAAQPALFQFYAQGVSTSAVTGNLLLQFGGNGATPGTIGTWNFGGNYTAIGTLNSSATSGPNTFAGYLFLSNTTTGRFIWFDGGGATIRSVFGSQNTTGDLDFRVNDATSLSAGSSALRIGNGTGNILINTTTVAADAALNINGAGNKGVLLPRLTTTQRDSINLVISSFTVVNGGTGYTGSPTVTPVKVFGDIPAVVGSVSKSGNVITSVAVTSGGSYSATPTVNVTGGSGSGAVITANMTQTLTEGLEIYNTTLHKKQYWDGTSWVTL